MKRKLLLATIMLMCGVGCGCDAANDNTNHWALGVLESYKKNLAIERAEFDKCVTNRANWRIVTNGKEFTAQFFKPSTGWKPYGMFSVYPTKEETESAIRFYINYFVKEQANRTNQWKVVSEP